MTSPRPILLLGATGSIGRSTLEVVRAHPDRLRVAGLVARGSVAALAAAAREFRPRCVAIAEPEKLPELAAALPSGVAALGGPEGIAACIRDCGASLCVSAIVGSAGLAPTLAAIEAGMDIALANKEALVAAGELVLARVAARGVRLLPVDSEHWALFLCLEGRSPASVRRLWITASGGALRGRSAAEVAAATPEEALRHPTWDMGAKITIDSATLANKALEAIEASRLFGLPLDRIRVAVHPQSLVHGLAEFIDGSLLAQFAVPDMRIPIQGAVAWPERWPSPVPPPDLTRLGALTFEEPDRAAFPLLDLGIRAGTDGGLAPCVFSAANEEAVGLFLERRLRLGEAARAVEHALETIPAGAADSLEAILAADAAARSAVRKFASR